MGALVQYRLEGNVATITLDDGKMNALSPQMLGEIDAALTRAEADKAVVVLTGREGTFSAGFDLRVLKRGGTGALGMLRAGFELSARVLSFPQPVIVACSGHAIAMGSFLVLSADYRIGTAGPFKITANEVAIGLTMPRAAIAICRQRLAPAHFERAVVLAEVYAPEAAVTAGFLDRVVPADALHATAHELARELGKLDMKAHAATKLRARAKTLRAIRTGLQIDLAGLTVQGLRGYVESKLRGGAALKPRSAG